ncbi:hypothetical protein GQ457_13G029070 [Hibiscus cannabinus]
MEVARSQAEIVISQRKYVLKLLKETRMQGCKPEETPMDSNLKFQKDDEGIPANKQQYLKLVGKLIYLSLTRPNIALLVGIVSQHMNDPREEHLEAIQRIIRYLKMTPGHGLIFKKNHIRKVEVYSDASWAGELTNRRSTTSGYCTLIWEIWLHGEARSKQ